MHIAVEMSLYPLTEGYIPAIKDFIERIRARAGLKVVTNAMSTQVSGEMREVMRALEEEMAVTFSAGQRAVFVMKVLGGGE
jgi:uncharacterized protein YqgV (UPF0045/DUF77 family)